MKVPLKTKLTLTHRHQETQDTVSFRFTSAGITTWLPGQYLQVSLEHARPDSRGSERFFTIASAPFEDCIQLTTRFTEDKCSSFKKAMRDMLVGDALEVLGVEGDFTVDDPRPRLVFIAGGIGVTPYRAMLLGMDHAGGPIACDLLYANRDEDFPFKAELDVLANKHAALKIHYLTGPRLLDEATIAAAVGDLRTPIFYVSGPAPMIAPMEKTLNGLGVPKSRLKKDYFPGYSWP